MADDALTDFTREQFTHEGRSHPVLRSGNGPAVIVMAELPGITPKVAAFARRVRDLGCTVVLPDLFGVAGRDPAPQGRGRAGAAVAGLRVFAQVCVSREFTVFAAGRTSPVVTWLRALAVREHERCGGPGVGAVGMCFTGGYALAMATDDRLLAPVLAQPSLPIAVTARHRRSIDISPGDLRTVQQRCADGGLTVLGVRFRGDRLSPPERFALLREKLGEAFVGVELDDSAANPDGLMPPHSVLTEHLVDEPGQPTRDALDQVLAHFRTRLLAGDAVR
ncbi:dienelactone hydrolase family protein [Streptacidiphilus melanogenes]|uniref:dienelactone hydrolase family protein n=1 Tax=Streptacidiphilus melanogenes TaxID=411235 RepID=UPI0005A9E047|nr:dienelactone hydrolase family protein [Streptacidiphilus melanogenes]